MGRVKIAYLKYIWGGVMEEPWPSEVLPQREVGSLKYETENAMPLRPA